MPTIITVSQLRSALGNPSTSLYSDSYLSDVIDTSESVVLSMLDAEVLDTYVGVSAVESAVLVVSLDVFRAQTAPAGSIQGIDFAPTPYPIGRAVFSRVQGILGRYIDVKSIAQ